MSTNFTKNALITGGAKRLGREVAIALARDGWNVAVSYHTSPADDVVAEIKKHGVKAAAIKADLLNMNDVRGLVAKAAAELGEITLLVNSASVFEKVKFMETDEATYDEHMDLHVKTAFFLAQEFTRASNGGQIINIVDNFVRRNKASYFTYLLAKKSLQNLSKMLAMELAPKILVNAVFPGSMADLSQKDIEYLKTRLQQVPMQQFANSQDVANAIIFLAGSNLTGQEIFIDGGEQLIC